MDKLSDSKHQVKRLSEQAVFLHQIAIFSLAIDLFFWGGEFDALASIGLIVSPLFLLDQRLVSEKLALFRDSLLRGKFLRPIIVVGLFILIGVEIVPKLENLWVALPIVIVSILSALKPAERTVKDVLRKLGNRERDRLTYLEYFISQQFRYYLISLIAVRIICLVCALCSEPLVSFLPWYVLITLSPPKSFEPCPRCYELRPTALGWYPGCEKCSD